MGTLRRCPSCGRAYKRLDRHLAGRNPCAQAAARLALERARSGPSAAPEPAPEPVPPPAGLGPAGQRLWLGIAAEFRLEAHHQEVLEAACREADAAEEADRAVAQAGRFITGRLGQLQPHPGVAAARSSRLAMARILRELHLEEGTP